MSTVAYSDVAVDQMLQKLWGDAAEHHHCEVMRLDEDYADILPGAPGYCEVTEQMAVHVDAQIEYSDRRWGRRLLALTSDPPC